MRIILEIRGNLARFCGAMDPPCPIMSRKP
jgi:hypothetical protein